MLEIAALPIAPFILAALKAAVKTGADAYSTRLAELANEKVAKDLAVKLDSVTSYKTIWHYQNAISIYSFYYPSRVVIPAMGARPVKSLKELGGQSVVIEGSVGMGKSILLRYLCGQELRPETTTGRIPVFLELRKIKKAQTFESFVVAELEKYGFRITGDLLSQYYAAGSLVLLLDAFDELDVEQSAPVIESLERLIRIYNGDVQIIVTSRPNSGIQSSPHFNVLRIEQLRREDHRPFFTKLGIDREDAEALFTELGKAPAEILALVKTPLLLTLLVMVYRASKSVPETIPRFYEQLFDTLFIRHDSFKGGYSRPRRTELSDTSIRKVFEALCFEAKLIDKTSMSRTDFEDTLVRLSRDLQTSFDASGFLDEMMNTAALLVQDGLDIAFIHKSVAEYYAASFVKNSIDNVAATFYASLTTEGQVGWRVELSFLEQIDGYRYIKYFSIPSLNSVLDPLRSSGSEIALAAEEEFLTHNSRYVLIHWQVDSMVLPVRMHIRYSIRPIKRPHGADRLLKLWAKNIVQELSAIKAEKISAELARLSTSDEAFLSEKGQDLFSAAALIRDAAFGADARRSFRESIRELDEERSNELRLLSIEEAKLDMVRRIGASK